MKGKKFTILFFVLLVAMGLLTGCGKRKIDIMEDLTVSFEGYDGYGTAKLENEYSWEAKAFEAAGIENIDGLDSLGNALNIELAVEYEMEPESGLSNGDQVVVKASISDTMLEGYDFELLSKGERTFTVSGLKEIQEVNLFENIEIEFSGIAPYAKAQIIDSNTDSYPGVKRYSLDKETNLRVGESVTLSVEYDEDALHMAGYKAIEDKKEFVVPELDKYVTSIGEIPQDTLDKMTKQLEDALHAQVANAWVEKDTLKSIEYVGSYLLRPKENQVVFENNILYNIYKVSVENSENKFEFYTYCRFKDIIVLADGTCSVDLTNYTMPTGSAFFGMTSGEAFQKGSYYYHGYEETDSLFNNCVTKNIEQYEYESTVTKD